MKEIKYFFLKFRKRASAFYLDGLTYQKKENTWHFIILNKFNGVEYKTIDFPKVTLLMDKMFLDLQPLIIIFNFNS